MKKCCDFLVNNMAIFVVLIGIVGAVWPQTLQWVKPYVGWLLGIVMFGMGMTLTVQDFKTVFKRPWEVSLPCRRNWLLASSSSGPARAGRHRMSFPTWLRAMSPCPYR